MIRFCAVSENRSPVFNHLCKKTTILTFEKSREKNQKSCSNVNLKTPHGNFDIKFENRKNEFTAILYSLYT